MPRLFGRTGNARTSWLSRELVAWLTIDGKLVVALSIIWRTREDLNDKCDHYDADDSPLEISLCHYMRNKMQSLSEEEERV